MKLKNLKEILEKLDNITMVLSSLEHLSKISFVHEFVEYSKPDKKCPY